MKQPSQRSQSKESAKKHSGVLAPTICLPKGLGAIRVIEENFPANPVTVTGSMIIPSPRSSDPPASVTGEVDHAFEYARSHSQGENATPLLLISIWFVAWQLTTRHGIA